MFFLKKHIGFSLIELLMTLTIIGFLLAFALPGYLNYITKIHRSEAISALNKIHLQQEQYRSYHEGYADLNQLWGKITTTPNGYYTIAISDPKEGSYTATATANGTQTRDAQQGVSCKILTLTIQDLTVRQSPKSCWK